MSKSHFKFYDKLRKYRHFKKFLLLEYGYSEFIDCRFNMNKQFFIWVKSPFFTDSDFIWLCNTYDLYKV